MLSDFCESVQLPSGVVLSSEHFRLVRPGKPELKAEIDFLNGMLYIWIGSSSMHQLTNLQIAYPGNNVNSAVCKVIIGEDSLHSSNQIMAKRLSQKFGIPVMLSFNYQISELEEDLERLEIFKWLANILQAKIGNKYKNLLVELSIYIKEGVLTEGALQCTQNVIEQNEGHYTAWSFRRKVLFALKRSLTEELEFVRSFTVETPKNYQLWQHRQIIVERIVSLEVAVEDLEATKVQLGLDAKNIHCWQYRQWLLRHFNLPIDSEFEYTEALLNQDVYNNSAWNHRMYLLKTSEEYKNNKSQCIEAEVETIISLFLNESTEDNECFWNYLAALLVDCPSLTVADVVPKLSQIVGSPENTENYLFLRFLSRFDCENIISKAVICEKLKLKMLMLQNDISKSILNLDFGKSEKIMRESVGDHNASVNLGIVGVLRALISRSETDYNLALLQLTENQKAAGKDFTSITSKLYPSQDLYTMKCLQLVDDPRFLDEASNGEFTQAYHQRSVKELISAECSLLQIFLKCIFTGEQSNIFSTLLSSSELTMFRTCFMTLYHAYNRFKILPSNNALYLDKQYRSSLYLVWGLCSLLTWLLPSQLATILGIDGFQLATVSETLALIEQAVTDDDGDIHSILAKVILLMYNLDIKCDVTESKRLVDLIGDPKSALQQYMQAKLVRLEGNPSGSVEILGRIRLTHPLIQMPVYWQMVQCFAETQKWPEAIQCIKSLRNCSSTGFPSTIFSLYLEASFVQASTGRTFGPLSVEVQGLLVKVLEASRGIHKAPRPFLDRMAIARARNVLERNENFFLPHYEVLLLWDRLKNISHKELIMSQVRKALETSGQLTFEQQVLGWLILAILTDSPSSTSILISNHIIPREKALPSANFITIRAKCELVHGYLLEGKLESAKKLLKEIEMQCFDKNGFPGQATILLLISKLRIQMQHE